MPFSPIQDLRDWFNDLFGITTDETWAKYVPMSREEAEEMLLRDLPEGTRVEIKVQTGGYGTLSIRGNGIKDERNFNLSAQTVYSGGLYVDDMGKGTGRKVMRNEIEFFAACGVKEFDIIAGSSAGAYTWARFGFLPSNLSDEDSFINSVWRRYEKIEQLLNDAEKREVEEVLGFQDKIDVWRLADMSLDMAPRLRDVFQKAADGDDSAKVLREKINNLHHIFNDVSNEASEAIPEKLSLGRVLMSDLEWAGMLIFDNPAQMARVEAYVGGWKSSYIKPASSSSPALSTAM